MAIVETYQVGGVTVHVADDAYKDRTPAQVQESIKQFSAIAISSYQRNAHKKSQVQ